MRKRQTTTTNKETENEQEKKTSDSDNSDLEITEAGEEIFTQDDFEDALRRVSRKISEPGEEKT